MQKVFHDVMTNKVVIDVSGLKTKSEIDAEYMIDSTFVEVEDDEIAKVVDGALVKVKKSDEINAVKAKKDAEVTEKINTLTDVGLTAAQANAIINLFKAN